jgi:hypothetical protein
VNMRDVRSRELERYRDRSVVRRLPGSAEVARSLMPITTTTPVQPAQTAGKPGRT